MSISKTKSERRTKHLTITLRPHERKKITRVAEAEKLTDSTWGRKVLLDKAEEAEGRGARG